MEFEPRPPAPGVEPQAGQEVVEALETASEAPGGAAYAPPAAPALPVEPDAAAVLLPEVQRILADGLYETYAKLPPALQQKFKAEGELTASRVARLLTEVKVRVGKIIELIRRWLALIPGVNRYYLEQEAKLKADALLATKAARTSP